MHPQIEKGGIALIVERMAGSRLRLFEYACKDPRNTEGELV